MSKEPGGQGVPQAQGQSDDCDATRYSEAVDLLKKWIMEDVNAVARACGVDPETMLKDALASEMPKS